MASSSSSGELEALDGVGMTGTQLFADNSSSASSSCFTPAVTCIPLSSPVSSHPTVWAVPVGSPCSGIT